MAVCDFLHELRSEVVNEGTQGQATLPGGAEVGDLHSPVALSLFLAPRQQPTGPDLRFCEGPQ